MPNRHLSETAKNIRRSFAIKEHRDRIARGEIDIGPITQHAHITRDTRDLRNPTEVGRAYLSRGNGK